MEPIKDVDLKELVSSSSDMVIEEKKKQAKNAIKKLFYQQAGLVADLKSMQKQVNKKQESLIKIQARIDKLRSGDWSVLTVDENEKAQ